MDSNYIINITPDVKYFMKLRWKKEKERMGEKESEIEKLNTC